MKVELRPLRESNLALIHAWYAAPHMRPFFISDGEEFSMDRVRRKFSERLMADSSVKVFIAHWNGRPYGLVQGYRTHVHPELAGRLNLNTGIFLDYFIGEAKLLGKGLGKSMIQEFQNSTLPAAFEGENTIHLYHDAANARALACSRSAGFAVTQLFERDGKEQIAMSWTA